MRSSPFLLAALCACAEPALPPEADPKVEAQAFLDGYTKEWLRLNIAWNEAEWGANTKIVEGDDSAQAAAAKAREIYSAYVGSVDVITKTKALLAQKDRLDAIQVKQLEKVLYEAAANPQTDPALIKKLIEADGKQTKLLYGYEFTLDGKPLTPNDIDDKLRSSVDLAERAKVWEASKAIGPTLKPGLLELRDLRNGVVKELGYPDYYTYQVSDYDMSVAEMDAMMLQLQKDLRPLYCELHTWTRYELAKKYGQPVPELIPAHWLPNKYGQDWSSLVEVQGVDLDAALKDQPPEKLVRDAEAFYVSLGFEPLPASFWEKSSLYPVAADAGYKKNTHASAWHLDLDHDVRSLMSVESNTEWYETSHHELGHIYYYLSYSRPGVPPLLREGANRAFHEAIGSQIGMAAMQRPFLAHRGLVADAAGTPDQATQLMLREALNAVAFIPFAAGTMAAYERALYVEGLPADQLNARWWALVAKYQGITPPSPRDESFADGLAKTHINDDPAQYYDYALSYFLLYQVHEHIATQILHQDPRATDYYGSPEVGAYLRSILEPGGTADWRQLTKEKTGSDLSAAAMVRYYDPLTVWLKQQNEGRTCTLPPL